MWKLGYEQARGCNEADSLKSGKQSHDTQVSAKGNETDSVGQQESIPKKKKGKYVPRARKYEIRQLDGNLGA